ncbi:hypothetical protein J2Z79_002438 [Symbiobacterium terraclitae]|uniref:Uncharacterized protein n=1 Tax=Symbiobacterium terraclitae TaxID=557451 RepID=A0ABS4JTZ7_9FIRM|nr:hypothetical protein [Symbiobacterium terraclitae]MBP2019022.1 hypothetical protein [Symbiobacterium terraclitae]
MKMEFVQRELQAWGEILITTSGGQHLELHIGDTEFDTENRVIRLKSSNALFVIDGDSVEMIQKHYGHLDDD